MTVRLVLATTNAGKLVELRRILAADERLAGVEVLSASDVALPEVDEDGETFADNALRKARSGVLACGLPCVADDSGLVVDGLGGGPGVHSARYAGRHGDDAANLELVLGRMAGVTDRAAHFVCVAALVAPDGREWTAEGTLEGVLVDTPRGDHGFGYDPIFQPLGSALTTAEMLPEQKDAISHRGKAFRAIAAAIAHLAAPASH
ncbi:MAG: RdgB/HAM1 family non-canonical purine NTP pyrophosphatase [Actinomycetota bacterium]|nr:RdgB/HAM1 family non-canonical purine NTP pyrophosphatase [Actinomycetota bacterium]